MKSETQNFSSMKSKIELDAVFTLFWILTTELTEENLEWCKIRISQPDAFECNVFGNVLNLEKKFTNTCCFFKLEAKPGETQGYYNTGWFNLEMRSRAVFWFWQQTISKVDLKYITFLYSSSWFIWILLYLSWNLDIPLKMI